MAMNKAERVFLKANRAGLDLPLFTQEQRSVTQSVGVLLRAAFDPPKRRMRTILDDISFDLGEGDRLAIIGRNGSGKSTLLKVLVGAYQPTRGEVVSSGSRQALLNLSLGFNPEGTVVENILLRGIAMGSSPAQAASTIDEVLEFSDLREKAGHRLRTLSSGQRMRLGFAMATSAQHQILIMDEWIGAGDASFVEKAKSRLHSRVDSAQVVVLASHNFQLLRRICNLGMVIEEGRVAYFGPVREAIDEYKKIYQATPEYIARRKAELGKTAS
ncbi:ABC transporter ATP-binding protein [Luteimonas viscosa]|uniref:ABC transporter ATP-binding protein n=2 Tax=Luteimonas viscosa TaxID=1132694 RepID=A0A5D4XT15_9GAMM|nr:ABC transporter ATP-binding protein [Luteimonas viscosa]